MGSFEEREIEIVIENDRRYCNETYFMPNDEPEQTRLNIIHQVYLLLLEGSLTSVPITQNAPRILDIGTGPGDWAIEMSGMYPNATIVASDIGVFDGGLNDLDLPNVSFQLDDARRVWAYTEPFDLVHIRGLSGAFQDWNFIYQQAFQHLAPGGYIEVADTDPAADTVTLTHLDNSYFRDYTSAIRSAAEVAGSSRDLSHLRPCILSAAGFVDVQVTERTVPIGLWPEDPHEKTMGKMVLIALLEGLEAYGLRQLTATRNWTAEGVRDLCAKIKREIMMADKMTARVKIITGRKPISCAPVKEQQRNSLLKRVFDTVD
ncbi:class I SAM-dependent methyltransferase [Aspergillus clavatus NRRL 1]|uniref:TAM domain methyltransferase n=1 Tax=Aspergillus clavatus (strain ATCC 1007 / CBS 513.65 / DSM 816 / NCTC 3887 / NRRL 1 / QM 1276 / 107) TaxID=344612 RepID=A1C9T2_ASPCL|nr:uncharacterized protein ACLA_009200 [Aspergillus clavatus NRRL 1]EAW12500.1 conserved hypothetical protein [Aspergillus clavatus NRRL 1]